MTKATAYQRCLGYIGAQVQPGRRPEPTPTVEGWRAVTISRQAGCGAHAMAEELVEKLQRGTRPAGERPWTIFDKNLVERVLEDHDLPSRLAAFMPEDRVSGIADALDELFGLHPPAWTLVRKTADTILHLATLGNVVLIGRGANVITQSLPQVFHVRLVGSLEHRIERAQEQGELTRDEALRYVHDQDVGRARYLKKYYGVDSADALLYHLVVNTDALSSVDVASIVGTAMRETTPAPGREPARVGR
jgi:cytidylate kinase